MRRIAVTGATGLVGSVLVREFAKAGHDVIGISRAQHPAHSGSQTIPWDIERQHIDVTELEGLDAIIHLAGANIAAKRWSASYKKDILESRTKTTAFLCRTLLKLKRPPKVFLSASAVGYYGQAKAEKTFNEDSPKGMGFLADVCRAWEESSRPLQEAGIRTVHMRMGVVLSARGGALAKMLPVFLCGLGGVIGSGRQVMSWICVDEIPLIMTHVISDPRIAGAVNVVSPHAVSNKEFTRVLGQVLKRPVVLPLPALAVKILFGEMGEELLLGGANVVPRRLLDSGYKFRYPDIEAALKKALNG